MAPIKLYGIPPSPAFRTAAMTLDLLGLEHEVVPVNPLKGETRTPEFLKLNPQHTIPVLTDGDFVLSESRVIATYLVDAYGKEDCKLLPKDPKTRAIIDQRLHFDVGTFFRAFLDHFAPVVFQKASDFSPATCEKLKEALQHLVDFIKPTGFVAGTDHLTVADLAFLGSVVSLQQVEFVDLTPFNPTLSDWAERCKRLIPNHEKVNGEGAAQWAGMVKSIVAAAKSE